MISKTCNTKKQGILLRLLYYPAFLFYCSIAYPQHPPEYDQLRKEPFSLPPISLINLNLSYTGLPSGSPAKLIPYSFREDTRTLILLNSLKHKASKRLITRKLYDFVIIAHLPVSKKAITGSSQGTYLGYSGKRIRKIEIRRLDVFGSDINNPALTSPNQLEKFLNKTRINTNEHIIRKNILFNIGDTISPLILSDNERLLRQLPFIDDARIIIVPVSETDADIIVLTKDVYSLAARVSTSGFKKGSFSLFDKNIFGMGQELGIDIPYNSDFSDSPGFGVHYAINNIRKSFIDLNTYYLEGLGKKTYGFDLSRKFVSSATRYAGGISIRQMYTSDDLDSLAEPAKVKYNLQDYWLSRSFLINDESVSRFIIGARYTNNNVFDHPFILPESFHNLQRYKMFLGSASLSLQNYHKANLIYGYGRTEDVPFGGLLNTTIGTEINEFKKRTYIGGSLSIGQSIKKIGYFYSSAGLATFINQGHTEQGMLSLRTSYISNLAYLGKYRMRNFINIDYTRGFDRYSDERLVFNCENGFSGFRSDSARGAQRLTANIESVLFSPVNFYGFRFALYGFADFGFLFGTNDFVGTGDYLTAIGLGIRIRNDNLIFNTLQIRLGFFPNVPDNSSVNHVLISGEQLLKPYNFEPGPPTPLPYR